MFAPTTTARNTRKPPAGVRLGLEPLDRRDVPSVSSVWASGTTWVVQTDNSATAVTVGQSGADLVPPEGGRGRSGARGASLVGRVEFQGGAGNDRFVDNVYA